MSEMQYSEQSPSARAQSADKGVWLRALRHAALALAVSAVLLLLGYSAGFFTFHPEFERFSNPEAKPRLISGRSLQPVVAGGGGTDGDAAVITDFANGQAIVASRVRFQAEDYPFVQFNIEGLTRYTKAYVIWRLVDNPEQIHFLPLNRSGDGVTQVAMVYGGDNYKGRVAELGIGFFDGSAKGFSNNNDVDIWLNGVELLPFNPGNVARQVLQDWVKPPLWGGSANNTVKGIHDNGMVYPNLALSLLVATSALLLLVFRFIRPSRLAEKNATYRAVLVTIGLCWALGDLLRWQWRIEQLIDTHERYAGLPLEERIRNNSVRCARFEDCRQQLLPYF